MQLALLAAAALVLAGCATPPAAPPPLEVQMVGGEQGNVFEPAQFVARAGDTVTWRGVSGHHTVTFERAPGGNATAPDSGDVGPGQTYALAFPASGTFAYRCRYHSSNFSAGMVGTVVMGS